MAITENAKQYHEKMFPGYVSDFSRTDPEFIERFDNFALDEVTRFMVILATLLDCQALMNFKLLCQQR